MLRSVPHQVLSLEPDDPLIQFITNPVLGFVVTLVTSAAVAFSVRRWPNDKSFWQDVFDWPGKVIWRQPHNGRHRRSPAAGVGARGVPLQRRRLLGRRWRRPGHRGHGVRRLPGPNPPIDARRPSRGGHRPAHWTGTSETLRASGPSQKRRVAGLVARTGRAAGASVGTVSTTAASIPR
jgi:hypothetical protein